MVMFLKPYETTEVPRDIRNALQSHWIAAKRANLAEAFFKVFTNTGLCQASCDAACSCTH